MALVKLASLGSILLAVHLTKLMCRFKCILYLVWSKRSLFMLASENCLTPNPIKHCSLPDNVTNSFLKFFF